jgi:hypothetical protein
MLRLLLEENTVECEGGFGPFLIADAVNVVEVVYEHKEQLQINSRRKIGLE